MTTYASYEQREPSGIAWSRGFPPPLDGVWYLDDYTDFDRGSHTTIGELVHEAKYLGSRRAADELGERAPSALQLVLHRKRGFQLGAVDVVAVVPSYPPKRPFDLAAVLGARVADAIGVRIVQDLLVKSGITPKAKESDAAIVGPALREATEVSTPLRGETILIVDDVVHNGTTLATMASLLAEQGSGPIAGFVAARARRGPRSRDPWGYDP